MSTELRAWRIKRGLSCKDVARALDWSESTVSRMETGERGLYVDDVAAVLGFLRVPAEIRQDLLDLVRTGDERNCHEIEGMVAVRMNRQRVLDKAKPPQLDLIIEEMVLRRTMDEPAMMAAALSEEDSGRLIADVAGKLRSAT